MTSEPRELRAFMLGHSSPAGGDRSDDNRAQPAERLKDRKKDMLQTWRLHELDLAAKLLGDDHQSQERS